MLERLNQKGFETYSVDNMQLGLQLVNVKKGVFEMSFYHAFLILGENMPNEKVFKENVELDRITADYLKGKKRYNFLIFSPVVCFWGEHLSDEAMGKCYKGLDSNGEWIYIGYETSSENVYYANAIEHIDISSYKRKAKWIKDIFQINDSIDSIY